MSKPLKTDWNNLDLEFDSGLNIMEGLTIEEMMTMIDSNVENINPSTVKKEVTDFIEKSFTEAKWVLKQNLDNIVEQAIKNRKSV